MSEPDWDAGTESRYEAHRAQVSDLCERCRDNVVVENDDFCRSCIVEVEGAMFEAEEGAYDLSDPKHPRHYETMVDAWDNREKVA